MTERYSLARTDARGHAAAGGRGARTTGSSTPAMVVWSAVFEAVLELKAFFDLGQLCVHSGMGEVVVPAVAATAAAHLVVEGRGRSVGELRLLVAREDRKTLGVLASLEM